MNGWKRSSLSDNTRASVDNEGMNQHHRRKAGRVNATLPSPLFTAAVGTPIYATADGTIEKAEHDRGGYGKHVIINHGYGYKTLYAHMSKIKHKKGYRVKRGDVIGYVGNTGLSIGPHLHYEVHYNGKKENPSYYYHNDLTPEEYNKLIELASKENQSFD